MAKVWYGIRYGKVSKDMAWYQVWYGIVWFGIAGKSFWLVWHNGVRRDRAHHWLARKKSASSLNTNSNTIMCTSRDTKASCDERQAEH